MANGWTDERKAKQRAVTYRCRPWEKSTGPKTKAGKEAVSRNAWKHGNRSREAIQRLREIRQLIQDLGGG